jgi:hypothetical protein|tara:strand:- start:266 stop:766 length:501 start_codon:yes stop_codon:yes gene_type:complete
MFKSSKFEQLQNLIKELATIASDEGTFISSIYTRSSGSYTRLQWRYKKELFSTEYPNSDKDKRGLHNAYMNTRKGLNAIGLSVNDLDALSKDYMGKNVYLSERLCHVWQLLEKERMGILWWFKHGTLELILDKKRNLTDALSKWAKNHIYKTSDIKDNPNKDDTVS